MIAPEKIVEHVLLTLGISRKELARRLGVRRQNVDRWASGVEPLASMYMQMLAMLPKHGVTADQLPVMIAGTVTADGESYSVDDAQEEISGGLLEYVSRAHGARDFHGEATYIRVKGDSMAPTYPSGTPQTQQQQPAAVRSRPQQPAAACISQTLQSLSLQPHTESLRLPRHHCHARGRSLVLPDDRQRRPP